MHRTAWLRVAGGVCVVAGLFGAQGPLGAWAEEPDASPVAPQRDAVGDDVEKLPAGAVARLGSNRFRHGRDGAEVVFAPDGRTVATCSQPGVGSSGGAELWDAATGRKLRDLPGTAVAFSPDGQLLAVALREPMVRVLDRATDRVVREIPVRAIGLAFSPDGKRLVVLRSQHDGPARVVDLETGDERNVSCESSARFVPDGRLFTGSAHEDRAVFLYDFDVAVQNLADRYVPLAPNGNQPPVKIGGSRHRIAGAFSPDGRLVAWGAFGDDKPIHVWETANGGRAVRELRWEGMRGHFGALALSFSPDGKTLAAVVKGSPVVRTWDVASGEPQRSWRVRDAYEGGLAYAPDGRTLACGVGPRLLLWDAANGAERFPGHQRDVQDILFAPDGRSVATFDRGATMRTWETRTGRALATTDTAGRLDERSILLNSPEGKASHVERTGPLPRAVREIDSGRAWFAFPKDVKRVTTALAARDGRILAWMPYVTGGNTPRTVHVHDTVAGRELQAVTTEAESRAVLSGDGKTLGLIRRNVLRRIDTASGAATDTDFPWEAFALSPDLRHAAVVPSAPTGLGPAPARQTVRLVEIAGGREIARLDDLPCRREDLRVAWSPEGRTVAVSTGAPGSDAVVHLVDVATGRTVQRPGHPGPVFALAFSDDGTLLASGGRDQTVLVWDATAGRAEGK